MSSELEERVKLLEEKVEVLWAGNPPHVRESADDEKPAEPLRVSQAARQGQRCYCRLLERRRGQGERSERTSARTRLVRTPRGWA